MRSILLLFTLLFITAMAQDLHEQFSVNNGKFSMDLYSQVKNDNANKNLIISPFSIQTCVALAYAGAAGKTADEIATGLHLVSKDSNVVGESFQNVLDLYKNSPLLKIANKFYIKDGYKVNDKFNTIATKYFHSEAENLDFSKSEAAASTMNSWVESKTNNKIKNLIPASLLDDQTRMVLINAIHFKGDWQHKFKEVATQKEDFWISENENVKVDMMNAKHNFRYGELEDLDAKALEMPYKDSNMSMLILLPNKKTGLTELEGKLKGKTLSSITQGMFFTDVVVKFPKFKTEFEIELSDTLTKLGMATMFSDAADFTNLLEMKEALKVSKVIHKAFIEVTEEGAEAAAATGMVLMMITAIIEPQAREFLADKPFLYMIKDNSGHNFFCGRYVNNN